MGDEAISQVFVDKYKTLYNSVTYEEGDVDNLLMTQNKSTNVDFNSKIYYL